MGINSLLGKLINRYLLKESKTANRHIHLSDFDRVCHEIIPGDILLVEGHNRASQIIKRVTSTQWTHAALYLGRIHSIENAATRRTLNRHYHGPASTQLFVDTMPGIGTRLVPVSHYNKRHLRICRPRGISYVDTQKIIDYVAPHIGRDYNTGHLIQLGLYILAGKFLPRRCLRSLFEHNKDKQSTKDICSALIAEAFMNVNFPILPLIISNNDSIEMVHRNPKLFKPSDFDSSPYFDIIKYPLVPKGKNAPYHHYPWKDNALSNDGFVSEIEKES